MTSTRARLGRPQKVRSPILKRTTHCLRNTTSLFVPATQSVEDICWGQANFRPVSKAVTVDDRKTNARRAAHVAVGKLHQVTEVI